MESAKATVTGEGVSGQASRGTSDERSQRKSRRKRQRGSEKSAQGNSRWLRGFREVHIEFFEGLHENPGNGEIAEPFVVGRNDEPGRIFRAATGKDSLVSGDVIVPALSL